MSTVIAALGDRNVSFLTHREIDAAIALEPRIRWVATDGAAIEGFERLWVLPGTPYRDDDAVMAAIRFARDQGMPVLGTCGGCQYMAVEVGPHAPRIPGGAHA